MLDASTAQLRTLLAYLEGPLPAELAGQTQKLGTMAYLVEGWPGAATLRYPTVALHIPAAGELIRRAPTILEDQIVVHDPGTPQTPGIDALYSIGSLISDIQIDVFAKSRAQRAEVVRTLGLYLAGSFAEGLSTVSLPAPDYYGQTIGFTVSEAAVFDDQPGRVQADEWRATLHVEAACEEIVPRSMFRMLRLDIHSTVGFIFNVPGVNPQSETITVFEPPPED